MNKRKQRIYVTAEDGWDSRSRVALNPEAAIEINDRNWETGLRMDRCWFGRNRIITQSYSIWENRNTGCCIGTRYRTITDRDEILLFCEKAEIDPPDWIEIKEA